MPHIPEPVHTLERELRGIFGSRLQSFVVYGLDARAPATHDAHQHEAAAIQTLGVVDSLSADDLRACTGRVGAWHDAGLATPLLVAVHEFDRSLDVFPFEFGAILADHIVISGRNPFDGLKVETADLRRACEVQARGHLLHLREGYLETRGRGDALAVLIVQSAPAFAALVSSIAKLDALPGDGSRPAFGPRPVAVANVGAAARHVERAIGASPGTSSQIVELVGINEISSTNAERLFPPYLDTMERLVAYVDRWR
jgi:hypothetical protein